MNNKAQAQKYQACSRCEHWGTVFSYKRLAHGMMCGYGQNHCECIFGNQYPSGFIPRKMRGQ